MSHHRGFAPERFDFLTQAAWTVEAVEAAHQLGVLQHLEAEPVTAEALATHCELNPGHSRLLLTALVGLEIAKVIDGGLYCAAAPGFADMASQLMPANRLGSVLNGAAPRHAADTAAGSTQLYPDLVRFLAGVFGPAAKRVANLVGDSEIRVLDVGAGAAPWSLAIAAQHPGTHVVAVDLPEVIDVTEASVKDAQLEDCFEFRCGDIFELDFGLETFDLVIAGGLCHLFDPDRCADLVDRLAGVLNPRGTLAIIEPLPSEPPDGSLSIALYALGLLTRTATGGVYPFSTYVEWLRRSGLDVIDRVDLSSAPPLSLIIAKHDNERDPT
jgi:ubiquinone/menaquinone biosynthesis C-methylase UbiE